MGRAILWLSERYVRARWEGGAGYNSEEAVVVAFGDVVLNRDVLSLRCNLHAIESRRPRSGYHPYTVFCCITSADSGIPDSDNYSTTNDGVPHRTVHESCSKK